MIHTIHQQIHKNIVMILSCNRLIENQIYDKKFRKASFFPQEIPM